ncbi:MAG: N-acetylornithine carbamoyltransferase [Polyangiaceae bacterium]|jgi:N-acetylornithine carbamoyltransferase|nr:N-acetylornithine carbamoyltransferase [Polyangiaceae bacterium]
MNRFLDLADLSDERLRAVLASARTLHTSPLSSSLAGRTIALVFLNPSLRTLASMQAGIAQLGGASFVIQPGAGSWKLEMRDGVLMDGDAVEHVREAIPVLAEYADALAVRCFAEGSSLQTDLQDIVIHKMAELCPKPFISLESAAAHPCQALADWKTLDDFDIPGPGGRFVLSWAYHPKALAYAVPASALTMAARRGMHVTVLRPDGYALPELLMQRAKALAQRYGGSVHETSDQRRAMDGAHVVYAKSWAAPDLYGRPEQDAQRRAALRDWCVRESWYEPAAPGAKFMHCLPVRRNVKVADEILDGPRSVVVQQAGNRLHAQKALMVEMLGQAGAP